MRLAKPHLDIGLFTNDIARQTAFWSEDAALALDFKLKIDANLTQHRYDAHGSVIKVNEAKGPLPVRAPSGFVELMIAHGGAERVLAHPGGDTVRLVPNGTQGVTGIGIVIRTSARAAMLAFYRDALGFTPEGEAALVAVTDDDTVAVAADELVALGVALEVKEGRAQHGGRLKPTA